MLTIDTLATLLKLSTRTIHRMLDKGDLPFAMKVQGSWRFQEEDVSTWMKNRKISVKAAMDLTFKEHEEPVDKKKFLMDIANHFSKLHIAKKTQGFLIDLLVELLETSEDCLNLLEVREFYEYFLPRLDLELIANARVAYKKLYSLYRKNPEQIGLFISLLEKRFGTGLV